jgi:hypothetical protein
MMVCEEDSVSKRRGSLGVIAEHSSKSDMEPEECFSRVWKYEGVHMCNKEQDGLA